MALAGIVAVVFALASPGVANADNSNNNTNTNDVTQIGNPSNGFPEPNENTNWPPTGSSWPPAEITNGGGENGGTVGTTATPIVMPMGEPAPTEAATASTSEAEKPIASVNTP
jgi:hypothetical protein